MAKKITKSKIENYLKSNGVKIGETTIQWVEELLWCVDIMQKAKSAVKREGLMVNVSKEGNRPYFQKNANLNIYNEYLSNFKSISQKLGLSPFDRGKLLEMVKADTDNNNDEDDMYNIING